MRRVDTVLLGLTAIVARAGLALCIEKPSTPPSGAIVSAPLPGGNHALPAAAAAPADDGNSTMPGKNCAATRFSGLNQITPANVSKLALAFTFSTATTQGYEAP